MNTKSLAVEIKDADKGLVTAVFSTFNVIDSDGDVTTKDAFTAGSPVRISAYGHESWFGALPVGKGTIRTTETEAILDGSFFMDTQHGQDTFKTIKSMSEKPGLQEWSYGYDVVESTPGEFEGQQVRYLRKLLVHEVSPVLLGAGINTRTLAVKDRKADEKGFAEHAAAVLVDVQQLIERAAHAAERRVAEGKSIADLSAELLGSLEDRLKQLDAILRPEGEVPAAPAADVQDLLDREYLRFLAQQLAL